MSKKSYRSLTVFCVRCKQEMTCPSNAGIIQCTKCSMIQDPFYEYDIKCNDCNHTLTYPITARIIQCPLCSTFMDVSDPHLSTMELIQHKSKKRKLNDTVNDTETDSNTTVSNSYGNPPNRKRRKIGSIRMYNDQWIEYESKQIYRFRPNRPNVLKPNVMKLTVNNKVNSTSNTQQSKTDFSKY
eukprot:UN00565